MANDIIQLKRPMICVRRRYRSMYVKRQREIGIERSTLSIFKLIKLCQTASVPRKKICRTSQVFRYLHKPIPLYWQSSPPSSKPLFHQYLRYRHKWSTIVFSILGAYYESNLTLLAFFPPEIAYLGMLFIIEMVCTACSADHLKNK